MSAEAERLALECVRAILDHEWIYDGQDDSGGYAQTVARCADVLDAALAARDAELAATDARAQNAEAELIVALEELARLRAAAGNLVGELTGAFGIAEPEIRAALGNTNVTCLKNRHGALAALLAPAAVTGGRDAHL